MATLKPSVANSSVVTAVATIEILDVFSVADTSPLLESNSLHLTTAPLSLTIIDGIAIGDMAGRPGEDIRGELITLAEAVLISSN